METGRPDCPNTDVLAAFVAGTLRPGALATLEKHLASCDECLNVVAHAAGASSAGGGGREDEAPLRGVDGDRFEIGHMIAKGGMALCTTEWTAAAAALLPSNGCTRTLRAGTTKARRVSSARRNSSPSSTIRTSFGWWRGLISNFENREVASEFGYGWKPTRNPPAESTSSLSVVAGGANGSGWALAVRGMVGGSAPGTGVSSHRIPYAGACFYPGAVRLAPANLSSKAGLAFWMKGDGRAYDILFFTGRDIASQGRSFQTDDGWKRHQILFEDLPGFGSTTVTGIWFGSQQPGPVAFEIDEIELF